MREMRGTLFLAVVVLFAILPATSWAAYPGANGRIAYTGFTTGGPSYDDDDIYSVLPDGTSLRQLTTNPIYENSPAWSANGRRLVPSVSRST